MQSALLHVAVAGALVIASINFEHSRQVWGSTNTGAGTAVAINSVKTIPLPSRAGKINPVANDTDSQVPQDLTPKPQPKKEVKVPDADAIPLKSRMAKKQPKPEDFEGLSPADDSRKPASQPRGAGRGFADVSKAWRGGRGRRSE